MKLAEFIALYDNWNGTLVINDRNCDLYAKVDFINIMKWFTEHNGIAIANVMAFGFYDGELCVRIAYGEQKGE